MKKLLVLVLVPLFLLSACNNKQDVPSTSTINPTSSSLTTTSSGKKDAVTLDIYSINDYHGRVSKTNDSSHFEAGISSFATYLKNKVNENPDNSIFLNAGDLWQDTYDSAMNKGELLTKAMVELNCEAMALGNHEFDWGVDVIKDNKRVVETYNENHEFTFLGANIYNYENGGSTTHASDLCSPYKVIERSGIKIGLIGGIGVNQLTSITSSNWENITFVDPVNIVKDLSDKLRSELDCKVIIYLYHGGLDDSNYTQLSQYSNKTGERYVDVGLLGHTHQFESTIYNGAPWIQSYQHGAVLGHVRLNVTNSVECTYYSSYEDRVANGFGSGSKSIFKAEEDSKMLELVNSYLTDEFKSKRDEKIVTFENYNDNTFGKEAGKMQAYITSKYIDDLRQENPQIPNIDVVINNGNRDTVNVKTDHSLNREDIFNLTPFTNKTIIAKVKGKDIANECLNYSNPYYLPSNAELRLENNKIYTVACIDYLLLHKNTSRSYNYFPSYDDNPIYTIDIYPFEIMNNYFLNNPIYDVAIHHTAGFMDLTN